MTKDEIISRWANRWNREALESALNALAADHDAEVERLKASELSRIHVNQMLDAEVDALKAELEESRKSGVMWRKASEASNKQCDEVCADVAQLRERLAAADALRSALGAVIGEVRDASEVDKLWEAVDLAFEAATPAATQTTPASEAATFSELVDRIGPLPTTRLTSGESPVPVGDCCMSGAPGHGGPCAIPAGGIAQFQSISRLDVEVAATEREEAQLGDEHWAARIDGLAKAFTGQNAFMAKLAARVTALAMDKATNHQVSETRKLVLDHSGRVSALETQLAEAMRLIGELRQQVDWLLRGAPKEAHATTGPTETGQARRSCNCPPGDIALMCREHGVGAMTPEAAPPDPPPVIDHLFVVHSPGVHVLCQYTDGDKHCGRPESQHQRGGNK